jgi:hypothetical protein
VNKTLSRTSFVFTLTLLLPLFSRAEDKSVFLSWDYVVGAAKKSNPDLAASYASMEAARMDYRASYSAFLPSLTLSGGKTITDTNSSGVWDAQGRAAMTGDGENGVWLAWIDGRSADVALYVQRVSSNGMLLAGDAGLKVAGALNTPSVPRLVTLAPGQAAVCWADRTGKKTWALYWTFLPRFPAPPVPADAPR